MAWEIAISTRFEPRLRLITPGPRSTAARIPATISLVDERGARPGRGIPRLQEGVRVDADDADAVLGGADDRRDGRPVDPAERLRLLRVQREQVVPAL